jgi:hypothetical protein
MMPYHPSRRRRRAAVGYLPVIALLIAACAGGGAMTYTGRLANPESTIPLLGDDVRELRWQTGDLVINATYAWASAQLDLAGQVQLQPRLAHYPVVDDLRVSVHALDGQGLILASFPLWSATPRSELFFVDWSFERHFSLPEGTRSVTFSYRGRMRDGGRGVLGDRGDDSVTWDFWRNP